MIYSTPDAWGTYLCHNIQSQCTLVHNDRRDDSLQSESDEGVDAKGQSKALHRQVGRNLETGDVMKQLVPKQLYGKEYSGSGYFSLTEATRP